MAIQNFVRHWILIVLMSFSYNFLFGQSILWENALGGGGEEFGNGIKRISDGNFIVVGSSDSTSGDVWGTSGKEDVWIIKLDSLGDTLFTKAYGGSGLDVAQSIYNTNDGGFIIAGYSNSMDGDVIGNNGNEDFWVLKLNSSGDTLWTRSLGGSDIEKATDIKQTADGGFIIVGFSASSDGDVNFNHGGKDFWVLKLNNSGFIQWEGSYGGSADDEAKAVQQTNDGGYLIAGYSNSTDGDVFGNQGNNDVWIVKINNSGDTLWTRSYGGSNHDIANSVQQTSDGGFIIGGESNSSDGDVHDNHGSYDFWVLRLNNSGDTLWSKALGGSSTDKAYFIREVNDGYIGAGPTYSDNGDVWYNHSSFTSDYWIFKLDSAGKNLLWRKSIGGLLSDIPSSFETTTDSSIILAGSTMSNDGDVNGNHGGSDLWVVKLKYGSGTGMRSFNPFNKGRVAVNPNPIFGKGIIEYEFKGATPAKLTVHDLQGKLVKTLLENKNIPSKGTVKLDLEDCNPGIYLLEFKTDYGVYNRKVILRK